MKKEILKLIKNNKTHMFIYFLFVFIISISLSYAYFTSNISASGSGILAKGDVEDVSSAKVEAEAIVNMNEDMMYPGHTEISSIKVIGTGNNKPIVYNLIFKGTNTFTSSINYKVYKTTSNIDASYTCNKKTTIQNGVQILSEECTGTNIDLLGSIVTSGTMNQSIEESKQILLSDEIILTSEAGEEVYYYIVIEYPNLNESQNQDIASSINGNITIEESSTKYQSPTITYAISTTAGNNDWYKVVSIGGSISGTGTSYSGKYCITTETSCTPDTTLSITDKTISNITLSNNTTAQRVCMTITDNYNQETTSCSDSYKVDNEVPTVSIASSSSTTNSITITVSGNDTYSGIATYYYSSNNGTSYTLSTSNSYTFSNLSGGTTYTIKAYAIDNAGNQSTVVSKSVATQTPPASETILTNITPKTTTPDFSKVATTDEGVYAASDGMYGGTSYYFRGAVANNYVTFAGFCWRIIRINGDGSIRLIYDGTTCHANGTSTTENIAVTSQQYNVNSGSSEYAGWSYTIGQQHGIETPSNARTQVENWYNSNLASYASYIADGKYCNDREVASGYTWATTSGDAFYYAARIRFGSAKTPTLSCSNTSDVFTVKIGLITADEVSMAGGVYYDTNNTNYYLYNGNYYWTMTPSYWNGRDYNVYILYVDNDGYFNDYYAGWGAPGLRPVINLNSTVTFSSGSGTQTSPYVVKTS